MGHWGVRSLGHAVSTLSLSEINFSAGGVPPCRASHSIRHVLFLVLCFLSALLVCSSAAHGQSVLSRPPKTARKSVRLVAVGDINLANPMAKLMHQKGRSYPFSALKSVLQKADIAFGNLECSVATIGAPIEKQFTFRADPKVLPVIHESGFDIVSLANNHAWDYGREALLQTVQNVRKIGVNPVGAGKNRDAAHRLVILRRGGMRIGFLAYLGLIPALIPESETEPSLSMASVETIERETRAAKSKVDVLIVSLHAGEEGSQTITPRQSSFAHAAIDGGANLVIGHHPHVVQKSERYRSGQIFYSLGNFVFSPAGRGTGALLDATLYSNGKITATLRRLSLSGGRPYFP